MLTRREVLKAAAVGGAVAVGGLVVPATAQASERRQPRIVIVGAGLAGLACADVLHRHGLRADVYEARADRVGGRCWSSHGWADDQVAEHGGEFIDSRHTRMQALARRFGLTLDDGYDVTGRPRLWLEGRRRYRYEFSEQTHEFTRRIRRLRERIGPYHYRDHGRLAREVDEMTARDVVDRYMPGGVDSVAGQAIHSFLAGFLGLDLGQLSGLAVVDNVGSTIAGADERWHVHGGNDQVAHGLCDSLPRGSVHLDAPLTSLVRTRGGRHRLTFDGVARPVAADHVVLALPFTTLRRVDLADAGLSDRKRRCIEELGMGTNAKLIFQLGRRPDHYGGWNGTFHTDHPMFETWESSAGQPGTHGLITCYFGGRSGDEWLPDQPHHGAAPRPTVDRVVTAIARHGKTDLPGLRHGVSDRVHLDHWARDPWTRGSYAAFLPGQYTRYAGFVGLPEGSVHFAGEHTEPLANQGYLEGAVRSGERAAREVITAVR